MKRSILGICLVGAMAVFIGIAGIRGIQVVDDSYRESGELYAESLPELAKTMEYTQRLRAFMVSMYNAYFTGGMDDHAAFAAGLDEESRRLTMEFEAHLAEYDYRIMNPEVRRLFDEAKESYYNGYKPVLMEMLNMMDTGPDAYMLRQMGDQSDFFLNKMAVNFDECMDIAVITLREAEDSNSSTAESLLVFIITLIVLEVILLIIFIVVTAAGGRSQKPRSNIYPAHPMYQMYPVYAICPADPSNPAHPAGATHIMYPVDPARSGGPRQSQEQSKTGD